MIRRLLMMAIMSVMGVVSVLAQQQEPPTDNVLETIVDYSSEPTLQQRDKLDMFIGALETTNLHTVIESGEYTVFCTNRWRIPNFVPARRN